MRAGFLILGIIFLVVGGILYFYPSQTFSAQTTYGQNNPVNSSANFRLPIEWVFALLIVGFLFSILGLTLQSPIQTLVQTPNQIPAIITTAPGPRGPRGSRGSKGSKGKSSIITKTTRTR